MIAAQLTRNDLRRPLRLIGLLKREPACYQCEPGVSKAKR